MLQVDLVVAIGSRSSDSAEATDRDILDAYLLAQKPAYSDNAFEALGDRWMQNDRARAVELVRLIATTSLCHPITFDKGWTGAVAPSDFVTAFSNDARWYTNALNPDGASTASDISSWGATNSTRDLGVAGIDDRIVGMVWAQEED